MGKLFTTSLLPSVSSMDCFPGDRWGEGVDKGLRVGTPEEKWWRVRAVSGSSYSFSFRGYVWDFSHFSFFSGLNPPIGLQLLYDNGLDLFAITPPPTAATTLPRFLNWNLKSGRNLDEPLSLINLSFSICKMRRSNNGSKICFITGLLGGLKEIIYLSVNSKVSNINASFCCTSSEMRKHRARGIHDLLGRIALNWEKGWTWLLGQGSCTYTSLILFTECLEGCLLPSLPYIPFIPSRGPLKSCHVWESGIFLRTEQQQLWNQNKSPNVREEMLWVVGKRKGCLVPGFCLGNIVVILDFAAQWE